jgi:hypothetical protein
MIFASVDPLKERKLIKIEAAARIGEVFITCLLGKR